MRKQLRDVHECKGKVTSVRLSEEQLKTVKSKAKTHGMSVSNYIITTAVNGGNALTPETLVQIQNLVNDACAALSEAAPEKVHELQKGVDELWQKLM